MRKFLVVTIAFAIHLSGCVEKEILDDLNIETAKGYDLTDEEMIRGTSLYPRYLADKKIENVTLTEEALSTREVLHLLEKKSEQPLVRGSLENVLISEKMARKGMLHIADSLQRDASVGARIRLLITDGEAEEILKGNYGIKGNSDYITNLVAHNIERGDVAESNLHLFLFTFYQEGHTSYLPIIERIDDKTLGLNGVALFKEDKMVDRISKDEMFYFKLLADKYSEGNQVVKLSGEEVSMEESVEASVSSLQSKHKINIDPSADPVNINVTIDIKGIIKEYTGERLSAAKIKEVEAKMESDIESHCLKMLKKFQGAGIDPIGFGQRLKHRTRKMDFNKWAEDQYPQANMHVKANVLIMESGTVE
ncbi:MAG: Ger(x)C family spore germination protein [Bacillota bacterium]